VTAAVPSSAAPSPAVALWGTGGPAAAQAAACAALGWEVRAVAAATRVAAQPLAREFGATPITAAEFAVGPHVDLVILTGGPVPGVPGHRDPGEISAVLDGGPHLVITPPMADTLADADAIIGSARLASARGQRVVFGDAVCAAPVVEQMFARLPDLGADVTHISSKAVQPAPECDVPPLVHHGTHGVAAALLAARLLGRGRPTAVSGERGPDGQVTDARLFFRAGDAIHVHASFGPPSGPAWDFQVAGPDQVLRVDLFPTPTLERNGTALTPPRPSSTDPATAFGFVPQLERFWADVHAGRSPVLPLEFGRDVLEIVAAAHAYTGGAPVALPITDR